MGFTYLTQNVVYFDQQVGALHAIQWSNSFFGAKTGFSVFSIINRQSPTFLPLTKSLF